jgi:hypothetical protein
LRDAADDFRSGGRARLHGRKRRKENRRRGVGFADGVFQDVDDGCVECRSLRFADFACWFARVDFRTEKGFGSVDVADAGYVALVEKEQLYGLPSARFILAPGFWLLLPACLDKVAVHAVDYF